MSGKRARESRSRELVSMVSHELRTPLTAVRGSLGLMTAGVLGALPEKAQSAAAIAERNSEQLVRIVNEINPLNLAEQVETMWRLAHERGLELRQGREMASARPE